MVQYRQGESYSSRRSLYSSPTSGGEHDFPPSQPAPHEPSHLRPDSPSYSFSSISSSGTAYSSLFNSGLDNLRQGPSQLMTPEVRGGWGGKVAKFSIGLKGLAGSHKGKAYLPSPPTSSYDSPASDFFSSSPRLPPPSLPQPPPPPSPPTGLSAGHLQLGSSSSGRSRSGSSGASGDQAVRSGGAGKGSRADAGEKAARVLGIRQVKLVPSGKAARLLGTENSAARGGAEGQERRKRRDGDGGPPEGQYYLEQGHLSVPPRSTPLATQQPPSRQPSPTPQYSTAANCHSTSRPSLPLPTNQRPRRPPSSPPFSASPCLSSPPYSLANEFPSQESTRLSYTGSLNLGLAAFEENTQRSLRRERGQSDWTVETSPPTSSHALQSTFKPFQGVPASAIYPVPPIPSSRPSPRPSPTPSPRTSLGPPVSRQNRPTRTNTVTSGASSASSGTRRYQRSNTLDALEGRRDRRSPRTPKSAKSESGKPAQGDEALKPAKDERASKPFLDFSDSDSDLPPRPPSPPLLTLASVVSPSDPFFSLSSPTHPYSPTSPHPYSQAGDRSSVLSAGSRRSSWGVGVMMELFPRPPENEEERVAGEGEQVERLGGGGERVERRRSWLGGEQGKGDSSFLEVRGGEGSRL